MYVHGSHKDAYGYTTYVECISELRAAWPFHLKCIPVATFWFNARSMIVLRSQTTTHSRWPGHTCDFMATHECHHVPCSDTDLRLYNKATKFFANLLQHLKSTLRTSAWQAQNANWRYDSLSIADGNSRHLRSVNLNYLFSGKYIRLSMISPDRQVMSLNTRTLTSCQWPRNSRHPQAHWGIKCFQAALSVEGTQPKRSSVNHSKGFSRRIFFYLLISFQIATPGWLSMNLSYGINIFCLHGW